MKRYNGKWIALIFLVAMIALVGLVIATALYLYYEMTGCKCGFECGC